MSNCRGVEDLKGFIYLNPNNVCTQWNIARGVFNSASIFHTHQDHSHLLSVSMVEMLTNNPRRLSSEIEIENIRKNHYPNCISRLNGLFVFDTPEDALNVMNQEYWGASQLYEEDLTDVGVAVRSSSRHDSNWIELIFNNQFQLNENWIEYTHQYWQGLPVPDKQPIWERIVDGTISIWGTELREMAIKNMQAFPEVFPNFQGLLKYSINAARVGSYDGECVPFLLETDQQVGIQYFMKMQDKDNPIFIEKMVQYFQKNPTHFCQMDPSEEWRVPNLQRYSIVLTHLT